MRFRANWKLPDELEMIIMNKHSFLPKDTGVSQLQMMSQTFTEVHPASGMNRTVPSEDI